MFLNLALCSKYILWTKSPFLEIVAANGFPNPVVPSNTCLIDSIEKFVASSVNHFKESNLEDYLLNKYLDP